MDTKLVTLSVNSWEAEIPKEWKEIAIEAIEHAKILYLPQLPFPVQDEENKLLNRVIVEKGSKNISYNIKTGQLRGCEESDQPVLRSLLQRFSSQAAHLLAQLFPAYQGQIKLGRTSFRPVEIAGRKADSWRKDDTRLHVDAFPSTPTAGNRILRLFTNINPSNEPRVWEVGEPFLTVAKRFLPEIRPAFALSRKLLQWFRITRTYRTLYDHYMLQIHNRMKADTAYQQEAVKQRITFDPGATWLVYTDLVSHAALSGRHVLEQSFYLPVEAMQYLPMAPFNVLAEQCKKNLHT